MMLKTIFFLAEKLVKHFFSSACVEAFMSFIKIFSMSLLELHRACVGEAKTFMLEIEKKLTTFISKVHRNAFPTEV